MKKYIKVSLWIVSILLSISGLTLFIYSFYNLSSQNNNISQGDVLAQTAYSKHDSSLVRQLKDSALSDWIATRNTTKLEHLTTNKELIEEIGKGDVPRGELESKLDLLAKSLNTTDYELDKLEVQYEVASLAKNINRLETAFNKVELNNYASQQSVLSCGEELLQNLKRASDIWLKSDEADASLLMEINSGIDKLESVQSQFMVVSEYSNMLVNPKNLSSDKLTSLELSEPFAIQLSNNYEMLTNFVSKNSQINYQLQQLASLKEKMKDTVDIPDLVGKTIAEAKEFLLQYNKEHKSGLVLNVSGSYESEEERINGQTPSVSDYDLMKRNSTIEVRVPEKEKVEEEPKPDSEKEKKNEGEKEIKKQDSGSTQKDKEETMHVDDSSTSQSSSTVHVDE